MNAEKKQTTRSFSWTYIPLLDTHALYYLEEFLFNLDSVR